jgi:hypothetical protein
VRAAAAAAALGPGTDIDILQQQQAGVLKLVALLQELLALSTASPRQPLSKAMGLLVVRLPVDWACLSAISSTGRVVMQVRLRQTPGGGQLCTTAVADMLPPAIGSAAAGIRPQIA